MAASAGVKLGKLKSLSEAGGNFNPRPQVYAMEARSAGASTPIEAGEQSISVTVNMSYDIVE